MIRIELIHEGRVVKRISSRLHESVVLEQLSKFKGTVDEIVYEGEISEGAKEILQKVAKKVIPAAMAAGVALGSAGTAKAQNYFPGTDRSVGQHVADIFSPNYREIQRQRQRERTTQRRESDAYHREVEKQRVQAARDAGRRAAGGEMPANVRVFDEARISSDGRFINLYGLDHRVTQIPRRGVEFVPASSQRLAHYIAPGGQVYYVRHAAGLRNESVEESTIGTIAPIKPVAPGKTAMPKPGDAEDKTDAAATGGKNNAATGNSNNDNEIDDATVAAIKKAGIKLSQTLKDSKVNETIRKLPNGQYRLYSKKSGRNLGTFDTKEEAENREREVNYFKHVKESIDDPALNAILTKYQSSWENFKQGGDITDNDNFYNELFSYFIDSGEMPYEVAKASDADPAEWITNKLDLMMEDKMTDPADIDAPDATAIDQALADKNIIMQIRRAADYDSTTQLRLGDGTKFAIEPAAAAKLLDMFDKFKPDSKLLMQKVLNKNSGIKQLLAHLGESAESNLPETVELDDRLKKYIANFPEEVGKTVDELKKKIEQEKGESRFKWAIGRLPDGRFLSGLLGTIKDKFQLPIVAQGVSEAKENAAYQSLNDVYPEGATEIWYWKEGNGRDFMMGYDWIKERRPNIDLKPYPASISDTHVLVGKIKETDPDKIYHMMQGEIWSPQGEARGMIKALGTGHTSMSVGDIVKIGSQYLMVDRFGFRNIETGKVVESMQSYMDPKKTAALIAHRIFDKED